MCHASSERVHSRYVRVVQDLPWGGTPMVMRFWTRRYFCGNTGCQRRIFAEQLPGLANRRARGTQRLEKTIVHVGLECGGEPGRRLCKNLGITTSGDTILRRLRAMPQAVTHDGNVIGVDDFAFRRGQHYGTIIVDHESGGVIDLLPDRTSSSLETWLRARGTLPTIVTRDRSGVYAKAVATAAPDAIQVADRWHLLANCREALVRVIDRHHSPINQAMENAQSHALNVASIQITHESTSNPISMVDRPLVLSESSGPLTTSSNQQQSLDRRARRITRYEQVVEHHQQGMSQREIALRLKMSRRQVKKLLNADSFPERARTYHHRQIDRHIHSLQLQWSQGVRNAAELTRHIRTLGYTGSDNMVRRCVAPWRTTAEPTRWHASTPDHPPSAPLKFHRPSSERLSWLLIKDDLVRRDGEAQLLTELANVCEPIHAASNLARTFITAVRERDVTMLTAWTESASQETSTKETVSYTHLTLPTNREV